MYKNMKNCIMLDIVLVSCCYTMNDSKVLRLKTMKVLLFSLMLSVEWAWLQSLAQVLSHGICQMAAGAATVKGDVEEKDLHRTLFLIQRSQNFSMQSFSVEVGLDFFISQPSGPSHSSHGNTGLQCKYADEQCGRCMFFYDLHSEFISQHSLYTLVVEIVTKTH